MSISGIHGHLLEVTVVGCSKLKDTEWISRQDPYVGVEYASTKHRTRTCTDGGKNPTFQEKFTFNLIEGLREICVVVWNSNTLTYDGFIGNGKVQLQKVLSDGYDDSSWSLQDKRGRHAGEIRLIMHYPNAKKQPTSHAPSTQPAPSALPTPSAQPVPSAPPYAGAPLPQVPLFSAPPPTPVASYPPTSYPPQPTPYPSYPPNAAVYPPPPYQQPAAYPPPYPPQPAYPTLFQDPCYPPNPPPSPYPPSPYPPRF